MWKPLETAYDSICEDFGFPSSLMKLISQDLGLNAPLIEYEKGISSCEVVKWNEFGNLPYESSWMHRRRLNGYTYSPGSYRSYGTTDLIREDLLSLGTTQVYKDWECDLQDVAGFAASKSDLTMFKSTDEMVERNSKEMINEITLQKLQENLAWDEIRILHGEDDDFLECWKWDGRIFLINSGGSHHLSAAKLIASKLDVKVPLKGRYRIHGLNEIALASLRQDFDMYVMSSTSKHQVAFHEAMRGFKATYYWKALPRPYTEQCAIFLPKAEARSAKVSEVLRRAGFQDLGLYLKNICQ